MFFSPPLRNPAMYRCCCGLPFFKDRFQAPESPPHPHHRLNHHHPPHHRHRHHHDRELGLDDDQPHHHGRDRGLGLDDRRHPHRHHRDRSPRLGPDVVVVEEIVEPIPKPEAEAEAEPEAVPGEEVPAEDPNAALKALAWQAEGFGRDARGGVDGKLYVVTSLEDDESCHGTLRHGCVKEEPLWIVFELSGTIALRSPLRVASHKTIDGRGQKVTISGKGGIQLKECQHVIICNLSLEGGSGDDADAIQIKPNSQHIWVDRCTLSDYDDGLIDITRSSTDITISRCRFLDHDKAFLIGADKSHVDDRCIRVTIHHCFFDSNKQYQPRVRFAKVHLYNNYTRNWGSYAVCAGVESQILSQSCIYEAGEKNKKKAFKYDSELAPDRDDSAAGSVRSEGDVFSNGGEGEIQDPECVFDPHDHYPQWTLEPADEAFAATVAANAGWQHVSLPPYE